MTRTAREWADYHETLKPHERPMLPGSPATPDKSLPLRLAFAGVGLLVTLTGSLGNAVVTTNIQSLAGDLGVTTNEAAWLPVMFVMFNACMNLILIKFRQQYGLRLFTQIFLSVYLAVAFANLFVSDYGSILTVRAVAGMASAGLSSLGILYLIQAFPAAHRLKGLILGIGAASFAIPLARLFSPHLLQIAEWQGIYLFELGMAMMALAATFALKLPPSERLRVFEKLDFVTFALFAPGVALLCAALGLGRLVWWTEAAWVGWALIGSIVLLTAALLVEYHRERPLINLRWMAGGDIVRLGLAILGVRIVLSEQTAGSVGFLQQMGVGTDQLHGLFWVILLATMAGALTSAFTMNVAKLWKPIAIALALIAVGAFMDSHATVLTRPVNLFVSQALLAFAAALFIGPAMMIGVVNMMQKGPQNLVSFIVVFSIGQNVGGLAGSALVGTLETWREKFHSSQLAESITMGDPDVVLRLQQLSGAYAHTVGDATARNVAGLSLLQQQVTQQAHVLAYNDVFLLIAIFAAIGSAWMTLTHLRPRFEAHRAAKADAQNTEAAAAAAVD